MQTPAHDTLPAANLTDVADAYLAAKAEAADAEARAEALRESLVTALEAGTPVMSSDGKVANLGERESRDYKVSGAKGVMALLRNNPELDPATLLSVKAAAVKKLPEALQGALAFTAKVSKVLTFR